MSTTAINYLNIFFMIISAWFAIILPFETFLFVYAVLGPLHYLTEINWIQSKNYFLNQINNKGFNILILFIGCSLFFSTMLVFDFYLKIFSSFYEISYYRSIRYVFENINYLYMYIAFMAAIGWVFFDNIFYKWLWILISAFIGIVLIALGMNNFITWFSVFLPTIIHVWLFTGFFVIAGAIKSKSPSGWFSLVVFILISIGLFFIHHDINIYQISNYTRESFIKSNFNMVNMSIYDMFFRSYPSQNFSLNSQIGLKIQSLIAFAYTYHYLNWFSKTSIIKWHEVSRIKLLFTVIFWLICLVLYYYDYILGLAVLYFLSVLHVIMEFPLNALVLKQLLVKKQ